MPLLPPPKRMDLPIVIEIVNTDDKVQALLPFLDDMIGGGPVTLEKIKVIHYCEGRENA
jgi:uncharacterized protein